ncbi:DUF2851 family protein [Portibacter lacus]|uniref:DUF2851 domain-containing protein n=1 Tax=Portibacter lacus TaxID=1099794 RepID=A0AA37SQC8_9BACT|nr:DUF2851 family protein [Portibacter lacus]GLR17950.1 hypothetical protein GCM10007940_25650 [Portibacter lacus]
MVTFQEDLLHYVWKLRYFDFENLKTVNGESVEILHPGFHNFDAGPDFSAGKIKIGSTIWNGNIELHLRASDWVRHAHYNDDAYDNVILHVVYDNDEVILRKNGSTIPCITLKNRIDPEIFDRYHYLSENKSWVPCENLVTEVEEIQKQIWLERLFVARLEEKSKKISELLDFSKHNWEYVLFIMLGRYFGSSINSDAFESLCKSINLFTIYKNRDNTLLVESLLFGQAGFLKGEFKDPYPNTLKNEYKFIKHKYKLDPIPLKLWKFFRLRPSNFPTIRIAQFAALINKKQSLFNFILEANNLDELYTIFDISTESYWETHYMFDKESTFSSKNIGKGFQNIILINAVIPLIFIYGKLRQEQKYIDKAIAFMQEIPPERNKVISKWKKLKFKVSNAADTQALIHLKKEFCDRHRCLQCAIGHQVLKEDYPVYGLMYHAID